MKSVEYNLTLPETNIAPENRPSQTRVYNLPTPNHPFSGAIMFVLGRVTLEFGLLPGMIVYYREVWYKAPQFIQPNVHPGALQDQTRNGQWSTLRLIDVKDSKRIQKDSLLPRGKVWSGLNNHQTKINASIMQNNGRMTRSQQPSVDKVPKHRDFCTWSFSKHRIWLAFKTTRSDDETLSTKWTGKNHNTWKKHGINIWSCDVWLYTHILMQILGSLQVFKISSRQSITAKIVYIHDYAEKPIWNICSEK